jgi:flagellar assembly protein FliH
MTATDSVRLIKARSPRPAASASVFNFDDLRRQCDDFLADSRQTAEQLVAQATAEAEEIRRQAYAEGFQAGQAAGLAAAEQAIETKAVEIAKRQTEARIQTALPALTESVRALRWERDRWLACWEQEAVKLSAAIAERIVRAELRRHPEISRCMLREALELAAGSSTLKVRLHPQDLAILREYGQDEFSSPTQTGEAEFHPDPAVSPGGCVIETRHGVVDARIETLIHRISNELLDAEPS